MRYRHKNFGTCSTAVAFDINDGVVSNVEFTGGCHGNLKAIAKLVNNWKAEDIAKACLGNTCGFKDTSCADQLAKAVLFAAAEEKGLT